MSIIGQSEAKKRFMPRPCKDLAIEYF